MRVTRRSLRKTIRRVLAEGMKEVYGEIQNAILGAPSSIVGSIDINSLADHIGEVSEYNPSQEEIDQIVIDMIKDGMLEIRPTSDYR